jgi:hypothetical protein
MYVDLKHNQAGYGSNRPFRDRAMETFGKGRFPLKVSAWMIFIRNGASSALSSSCEGTCVAQCSASYWEIASILAHDLLS